MSADIAGLLSMSAVLRQVTAQAIDDSEYAHATLQRVAQGMPVVGTDGPPTQLTAVVDLAQGAVVQGAACADLADSVGLAVAALRRALAEYCDVVEAADRIAPADDGDDDFGTADVIAFPGFEGLDGAGLGSESAMFGSGNADSTSCAEQNRADHMRQDASESLRRQCLALAVDLETARQKFSSARLGPR